MVGATVVALLLVVSPWASDADESTAGVTPIQKVLQMMDGMVAKGVKAKNEEEVQFAKFHEWCDRTRAETIRNIEKGAASIVQLNADIDKAAADVETIEGEIAVHENERDGWQADAKQAKVVRKQEHDTFEAAHRDFSESIDAIARAKEILTLRTGDVKASLLQVRDSPKIPMATKAAVESFLALSNNAEIETGAPEANAYEFQSQSVLDMLENLAKKFKVQVLDLTKQEHNEKANFEVLSQKLHDEIEAAGASISRKTTLKASRQQAGAEAKGDLEVTKTTKAEDENTLSDTNAECLSRAQEYEGNQVLRRDEITALGQAIEIIQSGAVSGSADKHLPAALLQKTAVTSFSQLRSSGETDIRQRVVAFLQGRSHDINSRYLSLVATHAEGDPFKKVKTMIKDLIVKLMEQANEEADEHAYCETELATNKMTRENKENEVEKLSAEVEQHEAAITKLAEEIADLSDAVAELKASQANAAQMRAEEKKENAMTMKDAKEAQEAVERAMQILRTFYDKNDGAFLQNDAHLQDEMAAVAKAPYTGMGASSGGILGMLDVILSDFARLEAQTSSGEDEAQRGFEKFTDESNQDVAVKETAIAHKDQKKQQTGEAHRALQKQLKLTQEELDAALAYYDKLKPDCVDLGLSYEEKKQHRLAEIESLQEALKMLNQGDLA